MRCYVADISGCGLICFKVGIKFYARKKILPFVLNPSQIVKYSKRGHLYSASSRTHLLCSTSSRKQGDHLSGKAGNVREFDSCQGNVSDFTENQGIFSEKILSGKSCLKLFIVNCIFVSIQVFSRSLFCLKC